MAHLSRRPITYTFTIRFDRALEQLQSCLNTIREPPTFLFRCERLELVLDNVDMTPSVVALLVQILNQPLTKASTATEQKWDRVKINEINCLSYHPRFLCSQDEIQMFVSTLARRTASLTLCESREILECLFNTPQVDCSQLSIIQDELSASECRRVGDMVQRSVSLQSLEVDSLDLEEPMVLGELLVNALHPKKVCMKGRWPTPRPWLTDLMVRNCIVGQLLSPQSQLQKLQLQCIVLEDRHFLAIVEMLPTSPIQVLDVMFNLIGHQGILAFARQLPRLKCLREVVLALNAWEQKSHYDRDSSLKSHHGCMKALLLGMFENYSIELLDSARKDKRLDFCTRANRIRRQVLETSDSIPVGLWPLILEQVGTPKWHPSNERGLIFPKYRADTVYFVLTKSPILFIRSAISSSNGPRKRKLPPDTDTVPEI